MAAPSCSAASQIGFNHRLAGDVGLADAHIEGDMEFSATSRRVGLFSVATTAILVAAYAITLAVGLLSLTSPEQPIENPEFSILEIVIIVMTPAVLAMMVAVHAWAPTQLQVLSLTAVVFTGLLALVTCTLHFVILTLSRNPAFADEPWLPLIMTFKWPSLAYAVDIVGWDIFFPLAMLFAAPVFNGSPLAICIRWLMVTSGVLAFAGLLGVVLDDMQWRNIGIAGYVPVFLIVVVLLGVLFYRTVPRGQRRASDSERVGETARSRTNTA
jgi:hypothetical protein